MISEISIINYRCFRQIDVKPLGRINLISGKNGVGKTTFLEAVWLLHGRRNPSLVFNPGILRLFRPKSNPLDSLTHDHEQAALLEGIDSGERIQIGFNPGWSGSIEVDDGVAPPSEIDTQFEFGERDFAQGRPDQIFMTGQDKNGPIDYVMTFRTTENGFSADIEPIPTPSGLPSGVIIWPHRVLNQEFIDRYSNVVRDGKKPELIEFLKYVEPRVQDLEILTEGRASLWCRLEGTSEMLPIQFLGEGISHFFSILVSMYYARDGMIAIDEIENGLHYTILEKLWRTIGNLAQRLNVQVFATTHSRECIEAAFEAGSTLGQIDDLMVTQLYRKGDDVFSEAYGHEKLAAALESGFGIR